MFKPQLHKELVFVKLREGAGRSQIFWLFNLVKVNNCAGKPVVRSAPISWSNPFWTSAMFRHCHSVPFLSEIDLK